MEEGGVERVVLALSRELVKRGHESHVLSKGGRLVSELEAVKAYHVAIDLKSKNPLTALPRAWRLASLCRSLAADAIIAHSRVPAWLFVLARRFFGLKARFFTFAHGANSVSAYSAVMTKGERVLVPSRFLGEYLKENYSFDHGRIRVVSPCVDLEKYDPAKYPAAEGVGAVAIGRITPLKGFENAIGLAASERKPLTIVGGVEKGREEYFDSLQTLAGEVRDRCKVTFVGAQKNTAEWLAKAQELIVGNSKKPESFGLTVAEALAMNKKVRLFRHFGGAAEIVEAVQAEIAAGRAADSREAVRNLYSPEAMIAKFLAAIEEPN